jgi:CYTH domain-containing protein
MLEIERKFLVKKTVRDVLNKVQPIRIAQSYLVNEKLKSVRIRIADDSAFLTIKNAASGITRKEFEYEIPKNEAEDIIKTFDLKVLRKERYPIIHNSKLWEVDVFGGRLQGLVLAEIELNAEDEKIQLPEWIDIEVTHDASYLNASLINRL